jgi:two-component system cell cycle sensor histidine kinase/response regulator CckA
MKSPMCILHLEHDANDVELVQAALENQGIDCQITQIQTKGDYVSALEGGGIDLILSDYALPAYDGLSAAKLAFSRWPSIPLILVSGSHEEETIIDSFETGVTDWIPKGELSRLAPAVRRVMKEVEERSERRRLETQVIESQKMEVISQFSSGMAHDFNNILAVIVGYSDLLTAALSPDSPLQKYTQEIRHASDRAAALTRQMQVFSQQHLVQPHLIDPKETVQNMEGLMRRLMGEKIEMTIVPGQQTGRVKADAGYLEQLILNLVLNARDAMPDGGKLIIGINNVTIEKSSSALDQRLLPGEYVMLSVLDTGIGMNKEVKAHLFKPFFTTKRYGTGLGLATCWTIVQKSEGFIQVASEIGKGTTFKIYLPLAEQARELAAKSLQTGPLTPETDGSLLAKDEPARPKDCAPCILVVEDDNAIRELTTEMLIGFGYQVDDAPDGAIGWEALQAKCYDLLITDNAMPKLTGAEMVKNLQAAGMRLPVIMATALFPEEEVPPGLGGVTTLLKPFRAADLLSAVKKVLSGGDRSN